MRYVPYSKLNVYKFTKEGIIFDTNTLYLFLIGLYDSKHNTNFLASYGYSKEDFNHLVRMLSSLRIKHFIITPNVLTQFCYQITKYLKGDNVNRFLEEFLPNLKNLDEKYIGKNRILDHIEFERLGLTDVSLILTSEDFIKENKRVSLILDDRELASIYDKEKRVLAFTLEDLKSFKYTFP